MATFKDRWRQFVKWNKSTTLNGKIDNLIANRPQYVINDEYYDNSALAKARAFGRDRTIQMAEENVDKDVASATGQAKNISGSTGAVLDTLRAVASGGMDTKRNLATQEVGLRDQRMNDLYNTNTQLAEEKDKAWNFNVNEPYQNKIMALRQKRRFRQELAMKAVDLAGTIGAAAMTGGTSLATRAASTGASQVANSDVNDVDLNAPIDGYGNTWPNYG